MSEQTPNSNSESNRNLPPNQRQSNEQPQGQQSQQQGAGPFPVFRAPQNISFRFVNMPTGHGVPPGNQTGQAPPTLGNVQMPQQQMGQGYHPYHPRPAQNGGQAQQIPQYHARQTPGATHIPLINQAIAQAAAAAAATTLPLYNYAAPHGFSAPISQAQHVQPPANYSHPAQQQQPYVGMPHIHFHPHPAAHPPLNQAYHQFMMPPQSSHVHSHTIPQQPPSQMPPPNDVFMQYQPPSASNSSSRAPDQSGSQQVPQQGAMPHIHVHAHSMDPNHHRHFHIHAVPNPQAHPQPPSARAQPQPVLPNVLPFFGPIGGIAQVLASGMGPNSQTPPMQMPQGMQIGGPHPHLQVRVNVAPQNASQPPRPFTYAGAHSSTTAAAPRQAPQMPQNLPRPQPVRLTTYTSFNPQAQQQGSAQAMPVPNPVGNTNTYRGQQGAGPHGPPQQPEMNPIRPFLDLIGALTGRGVGGQDINVEIRVVNGAQAPPHVIQNLPPGAPMFDQNGTPVRVIWEHGNVIADIGPGSDEPIAEYIQSLLNAFHMHSVPMGISQNHLQNLPTISVTKNQVEEDKAQCAVCLEFYTVEEKVAILGCRHMFHKACLEPWLRNKASCPVCRLDVNPHEWPGNQTRRGDATTNGGETNGYEADESETESGQSNTSQPSETAQNMQDMDLD